MQSNLQLEKGDIVPAIPPIKTAGYEETAVHRITDDDPAVTIPEFHRIEEHTGGLIFIDYFPTISAVGCFQNISGFRDSHNDSGLCVKGFDIPEIPFFVTRDRHPSPGLAAIERFADRTAAATDPDHLIVDDAQPPEGTLWAGFL
jgi:hypothetical protein